ncbi:hypothetical protein HKX48_001411 [Thoreauomyces humboldtii]|nr:hypothetical protein HKX48_001411 [Thoreauomyces humboldtii]
MTIRPASYSGVRVYEIQCRNVPVMRRMADAYINATQILRAAGLPKPQRTKILERDVTGGVHEKVQGGYAGFQGTWIPLDSARLLAAAHGVEQDMEELLSYVPQPGDEQLPAKEKRKRAPKEPALAKEQKVVHIKEPVHIAPMIEAPKEKWTSSSSSHHSDTGFHVSDGVPSSSSDTEAYHQQPQRDDMAQDQDENEMSGDMTEGRRTTTMALRPPGSRVKRRPVYPGEDDEDSYSMSLAPAHPISNGNTPSKKRRFESPRGASPVEFAKHVQQQHVQNSYSRSPSVMSRDKTPPHAGKRCEGCGVTSTPQWRRGPSGKRTLCNACGVKWSFGRLNPQSGKSNTGDETESDSSESDSEDAMEMDHGAPDLLPPATGLLPMDQLLMAAGVTQAPHPMFATPSPTSKQQVVQQSPQHEVTQQLESQIKTLKRKLRESERGRKRLCKILEDAICDDSSDNKYRQVATPRSSGNRHHHGSVGSSSASPARSSFAYGHYAPVASPQDSDNQDESDDSADDAAEQVVVVRFLRAVRENRARLEYNIGRMRFAACH